MIGAGVHLYIYIIYIYRAVCRNFAGGGGGGRTWGI